MPWGMGGQFWDDYDEYEDKGRFCNCICHNKRGGAGHDKSDIMCDDPLCINNKCRKQSC